MNRKPLVAPTPEERKAILAKWGLDENLVPLSASAPERQAAVNPGAPAEVPMSEETPDTSPTGTPVIPPKAVPFLAILIAIAAAVAEKAPDLFPSTDLDQTIARLIVTAGAIFGIVSPGLRKRA